MLGQGDEQITFESRDSAVGTDEQQKHIEPLRGFGWQ
jgi:hypothetical protein